MDVRPAVPMLEVAPVGFKAEWKSIDGFGQAVADLNDDSQAAVSYADKWLEIDHNEARMFAQVVGKAAEVQDALRRNYQRLGEISAASSDELKKSAKFYQDTDTNEAERLDNTY